MSNKAIIRVLLNLSALCLSAAAQPQTITGKVVGVTNRVAKSFFAFKC